MVGVNYVKPMTGNITPSPPPSTDSRQPSWMNVERPNFKMSSEFPAWMEPFREWSGRESGLPGLVFGAQRGANEFLSNVGKGVGSFFSGVPLPQAPGDMTKAIAGSPSKGPAGPEMTPEEYYAQQMAMLGLGGGGGGGRPDFSAYREALTGQAGELNARIQAMYNQLAKQAGANVGRIQDIYGGAQAGVGDIYDSATGNIQDAFSSSQQQAADQMARLGIEAAAPAVIDPMALSQAQAVSGLETGRAGGLAALERYGSTAGDFGSQMAQVAQQQGTEMNAAILASLQNRLADSLAAEQGGGGGGGGGGMSVRDQMAFMDWVQEGYNRDILNQPSLAERQQGLREAEALAGPVNRQLENLVEGYMKVAFPPGKVPEGPAYFAAYQAAQQEARRILGLQ